MAEAEKSFKILIVDDEEQIIDILRTNLEKRGYVCEWAFNGVEALEKIVLSPPDLLVTDIKMPRMDGLELIEKIKSEGIEIPVVVITAFFDIDNAIKALRLGAVNFFKKPFDFQSIYDTVFKIEKLRATRKDQEKALDFLEGGEIRFVIPSNIDLIDGVSSYISERAADIGIVPHKQRFYTQLAIDEALSNAILHGNLNIKGKDSQSEKVIYRDDAYKERLAHPELAAKKVFIEARLNSQMLEVSIEDQGDGFDHKAIPNPTDSENVFRYHGRGIFVMRNIMDEVIFNDLGNRITLKKYRESHSPV